MCVYPDELSVFGTCITALSCFAFGIFGDARAGVARDARRAREETTQTDGRLRGPPSRERPRRQARIVLLRLSARRVTLTTCTRVSLSLLTFSYSERVSMWARAARAPHDRRARRIAERMNARTVGVYHRRMHARAGTSSCAFAAPTLGLIVRERRRGPCGRQGSNVPRVHVLHQTEPHRHVR